uniref:Ligand-gated ion channel n=1 Tax=Parastrongyloides trichosuri TaxID=131310 RepID=A0A0N4ZNV6_PARTI
MEWHINILLLINWFLLIFPEDKSGNFNYTNSQFSRVTSNNLIINNTGIYSKNVVEKSIFPRRPPQDYSSASSSQEKKYINKTNISSSSNESKEKASLEVYDEYFDGENDNSSIKKSKMILINTQNALDYPKDHPIYKHITKKIPRTNLTTSLPVHCGFYVESLGNFRSTEMTFDIDLYLYMTWKDVSLAHNSEEYISINDKDVLDLVWVPDLYFANARTANKHKVTVPNFNMYIAKDGTVSYGVRVTLNVATNLDLKNYPHDKQQTEIKIISYAHVTSEMNVTWFTETPINFNDEIGLPEFKITGVNPDYCNGTFRYTLTDTSYRIGQFSCLKAVIQLDRAIGYHLVQSYIPTALIVIISWVSFWIDRRVVQARIFLSFSTLLTLSTQANGLRFGLPPVSYAKAIDFWYGICMLFIFGVLLEFAIVNSYMRRANKYSSMSHNWHLFSTPTSGNGRKSFTSGKHEEHQNDIIPQDLESDIEDTMSYFRSIPPNNKPYITQTELVYKAMYFNRRALAVDQISRLAFPGVFLLFNCIYWYYYLGYERRQDDNL